MKAVILIFKILFSILVQVILLPIRIVQIAFKAIKTIARILENTTSYLIKQVESEVLK